MCIDYLQLIKFGLVSFEFARLLLVGALLARNAKRSRPLADYRNWTVHSLLKSRTHYTILVCEKLDAVTI